MTHMATPSSSRLLVARGGQGALLGLLLAFPVSAGLAVFEALPYQELRDTFWVILASNITLGVVFSLASVFAWLVLFHLARVRLAESGAAITASAVTLALIAWPTTSVLKRINHDLLPGFWEWQSILCNSGLLFAGAVLTYLMHRLLSRWQQATWQTGRVNWVALVAMALIPIGILWHDRSRERDPKPDILVLLIDVLRADHLSCYGYERPTTPNIDRFAQDAILFENAISPSTFTKTSVASIFTGLDAHNHGVFYGAVGANTRQAASDVLAERFDTLAEGMFEHGLNTVAWVENMQLREFMGFAQGFSLYHDQPGKIPVIAGEFSQWLERFSAASRYFAYLHFLDLHGPYNPKPPFRGTFSLDDGSIMAMDHSSWWDFKQDVKNEKVVLSSADLEELEARHDEMLLFTDEWIGRILDNLRATGRYDDTLIVVTSDHGEGFWEHGFISHSTWPFEELCRVPLIIKLPNSSQAGRRIEDMVGLIDLPLTLLEFAGADPPEGLDGRSFLPLLLDPAYKQSPQSRYVEIRKMVGVRTDRWKYLHPRGDLYDLANDPAEKNNCADEHPEIAKRMGKAAAHAAELRESADKAEQVILDEETKRALKALGY